VDWNRHDGMVTPEQRQDVVNEQGAAPPSRTILVVDPSDDDRERLRERLARIAPGWKVTEASEGSAGLALARDPAPDCILLNDGLPDMAWQDFMSRIHRADGDEGPALPVIVLTDQEAPEVAPATFAAGALDYLVKGTLTGHGLIRAVENALERFRVQRKLDEQRRALDQRNRQLEEAKTELQHKVRELDDATRAKDQFLAVMSHEMRTPLNAILGYSDLLELEIDGTLTPAQRRQLDRIRVGSRHLLDLINDVLDIARADARKLRLDIRRVEVLPVLEEVTALLEREAESRGIRIALDPCPADVPPVRADLQRFRQVLMNLVGNALKFTEEGSVTLGCEHDAKRGEVRIIVKDTGIGIPPEVQPYLFTAFYQVESDLTRERGGSGLGLAISERLVRFMGGRLDVESTPGKGSVFTVTLDVAEEELRVPDAPGAEAEPERTPRRAAGEGTPISVVAFAEDSTVLRRLAERVQPAVALHWTTDPQEVAPLAEQEGAGLILLDIGADQGMAWRAAQAVQDAPDLAQTPVLLLPSIAEVKPEPSSAGGSAFDLGWVSLVPKPFTQDQLTRAVASAAGGLGPQDDSAGYDILVLDDDADSRRVAAAFLEDAVPGVTIREAPDGESGLAAMRERVPDVVVLDLMMPVLDGFGVIAAMRADPRLEDVPVVVLSAKSLTEAERDFLSRTAIRVLQKGAHRLADVAELVLRAAGAQASLDPNRRGG
jgi:signal transduction histidine kinase